MLQWRLGGIDAISIIFGDFVCETMEDLPAAVGTAGSRPQGTFWPTVRLLAARNPACAEVGTGGPRHGVNEAPRSSNRGGLCPSGYRIVVDVVAKDGLCNLQLLSFCYIYMYIYVCNILRYIPRQIHRLR